MTQSKYIDTKDVVNTTKQGINILQNFTQHILRINPFKKYSPGNNLGIAIFWSIEIFVSIFCSATFLYYAIFVVRFCCSFIFIGDILPTTF